MKYYIIAGEPSGDLHGANLMKYIQKHDSEAQFRFWGGDKMLAVDDGLVTHIRETSIMGFVEVVKNLSRIRIFFKKAKQSILEFAPDVVVFIDYPGFNLRMAKWAKQQGFKVAYYISPQLWAWKKGRVKSVQRYVDEMIVILPFELDFYQQHGVKAHFVGHPLISVIDEYRHEVAPDSKADSTKKVLAILPGSRKQEIKKMLPLMMDGARSFAGQYRLCIAMAPNVEDTFYQEVGKDPDSVFEYVKDGTYDLLSQSFLALVTSGTATLETALFGVPQVVCYKTSTINYEIGRRLVDLEYISLVNLIRGKQIVPELIQHDLTPQKIAQSLKEISEKHDLVKEEYSRLVEMLSTQGVPSNLAAEVVVRLAQKT